MARFPYSLTGIAQAVWNRVAIASKSVNPTYWNGTAVAAPDTAGYPKVTLKNGTGAGELLLNAGKVALDPGASSIIKSITPYNGTITVANGFSGNKDVTPLNPTVNVAKSILLPACLTGAAPTLTFGANPGGTIVIERVSLLDTTTVRFHNVNNTTGSSQNLVYAFWVVEFY